MWAARWRYVSSLTENEPSARLLWQPSPAATDRSVPAALRGLLADHRSVDAIDDQVHGLDADEFAELARAARAIDHAAVSTRLRNERDEPVWLHLIAAPEFGSGSLIGVLGRADHGVRGRTIVDLRDSAEGSAESSSGQIPAESELSALLADGGGSDASWTKINRAAMNVASDLGQRHFLALLSSLPHGVIQLDANLRVLHTNPRLRDILGSASLSYSWAEAYALVHPEDQVRLSEALASALVDQQDADVTLRIFREDNGSERLCRVKGCPVLETGDVVGVVASVEDVTEVTELHRKLERQVRTDSLTQLANRSSLLASLNESIKSSARSCDDGTVHGVIFLDLDGFKRVNDQHGHHVGDAVLVEVARRVEALAAPGRLVARLGGDEFVLACPMTESIVQLVGLAEQIHASIGRPIEVDDVIVRVGASIGLALASPGDDTDRLLTNADLAMYESKRDSGRSITVYEPAMRRAVSEQNELIRALESAADNDAFELYFEPVVDLTLGRVVGAESQLRWNDPTRGQLTDDAFMAAADAADMSGSIAVWMIEAICRVAVEYRERHGVTICWGINLTARQLTTGDLVGTILDAADRYGLAGDDLGFDAGDLARLDAGSQAWRTLEALSGAGFKIAVDDFGEGSLSLDGLRQPVVDAIKVHPNFTAELLDSDEAQTILATVADLSRRLGKRLVLSGVTDPRQLEMAASVGIQYAQGPQLAAWSAKDVVLGAESGWQPRLPAGLTSAYG